MIIGFALAAASRARHQRSLEEARARARDMPAKELRELSYRVLRELYHCSPAAMTVEEIADRLERDVYDVRECVQRLLGHEWVTVVTDNEDDQSPSQGEVGIADAVRSTGAALSQVLTKFSGEGDVNVHGGDYIHAGDGAVVNNHSTVLNSFTNVADRYGPEVTQALVELQEIVAREGNESAIELYETFVEQLKEPEPKRSVLRSIYNGIKYVVPAVAAATNITQALIKIID